MRIPATLRALVLVCLEVVFVYGKNCTQKDLCSCTYDDGSGTVDITSLGNTYDTPRFKDIKADKEGNFYSYNPCVGFTENDCSEASVCILNPNRTASVQIGDSSKADYKYDEESQNLVVAYTSGTLRSLKLSEVILICDPSACTPSIVANGHQEGGEFQLTLTTVCACGGGCSSSGPINCSSSAGGLSVSSLKTIPPITPSKHPIKAPDQSTPIKTPHQSTPIKSPQSKHLKMLSLSSSL